MNLGSRKSGTLEKLIGGVVVIATILIGILFVGQHNLSEKCYTIIGNFTNIDGIYKGSDIKISGIKIGTVTEVQLNEQYNVSATMCINNEVRIPKDSTASIVREGIMNNHYVKIDPGGSDDALESSDIIDDTQSSISLESLVGKFMFNKGK